MPAAGIHSKLTKGSLWAFDPAPLSTPAVVAHPNHHALNAIHSALPSRSYLGPVLCRPLVRSD